jgi:hypothetical protein
MLANVKTELQMNFFESTGRAAEKKEIKNVWKTVVSSMETEGCLIIFHQTVSIGDVLFLPDQGAFKTGLS